MNRSAIILEQFRRDHARDHAADINLTLRPAYLDLLVRLGNPHHKCPPVFHVAGTNGKGSTCAFLRAMLEAAGYKVHVYTSPHLVRFHERIRVAGTLISEDYLVDLLQECVRLSTPGSISLFEVATAVALAAFARTPADFTILETGLGGRLDATNVIDHPLATLITRLSYDHREYLGETLSQIATEKAGIMRSSVPCFVAPQPDRASLVALRQAATRLGIRLTVGDEDWRVTPTADGFHYHDATRQLDLDQPALLGAHQLTNAGLAIAALSVSPQPITPAAIARGLQTVEWPARLQHLTTGRLVALLPPMAELWLDGGHNDSAGEVLARQIQKWRGNDGENPRPLHIIIGMLSTKSPREFLQPLMPFVSRITTLTIPDEPTSRSADNLAQNICGMEMTPAHAATNLADALEKISGTERVLICGSLYLAGHVLSCN